MSLITTTNKYAFKEWLREYKKMFGEDPIIPDYMGLVSKFLTSSQTGVTSDPSKSVNIVLWETFDETIDLTGNLIEGEYYYFPALPNDQVKVKNGSSTVTLDFDNDGKIRNKNLGDFVDIGNIRLTLRGIGGTLGQAGPTTIHDFGNGVTASSHQYVIYDNTAGAARFQINGNGAFGLNGGNYGAARQVMVSNGSGSAVSWSSNPFLLDMDSLGDLDYDGVFLRYREVNVSGNGLVYLGLCKSTTNCPAGRIGCPVGYVPGVVYNSQFRVDKVGITPWPDGSGHRYEYFAIISDYVSAGKLGIFYLTNSTN